MWYVDEVLLKTLCLFGTKMFPFSRCSHFTAFLVPSPSYPYPLPKKACLLWPMFWLSFTYFLQLSKPKVLLKCRVMFHKFLVGVPVKI